MKGSKERNLMLSTSRSNSNCFSSILKSFTCGGNLPSPTPSDHHRFLPIFKSNGYIHPNPNELTKCESTSTSHHFLDSDENFEVGFQKDNPRQPGLVARLMGLESMPNHPNVAVTRDSVMNLRSKSLNSLHLYIYPDTFLDHVSPLSSFAHYERRKPCHRRSQTSSPSLCVKSSPLVEPLASNVVGGVVTQPEKRRRNGEMDKRKKVDEKGLVIGRRKEISDCRNGRKKGFENKVVARKCRVSVDQRTRKRPDKREDPRKEIKYTVLVTKLNKEKKSVDDGFKYNRCHDSKDGSMLSRRKSSSTKRKMDQQHGKSSEGLLQNHIQVQNLRLKETEDRKELILQVIKLTEENVRGNEWISFAENVKELGMDFGKEILEVLINQLVDELLG